MKIACGTDIIEIDRIKQSIEHFNEKFLNTIYTKDEIKYCESHKDSKYQHYAARFAVKEALYKALSEILPEEELTWKRFEVINSDTGKPKMIVENEFIKSIDISISHSKKYAVAMVTVLYEK